MNPERSGTVLVLSGQSGVGKDTILQIISAQSNFKKLLTCTTRKPRAGEFDGTHYHFVNEEQFFGLRDQNKLLDHVVISGHHYGMPVDQVFEALKEGRDAIFHLVTGSAFMLKKICPEAILVFVMAPSQNDILARLEKRGMTTEEIKTRLRDDPTTLQASRYYDFVVVNHKDEEQYTAEKILQFVKESKDQHHFFIPAGNTGNHMLPKYFATGNANKLREVNQILGLELQQINVDLIEPQGLSIETIVKAKAKDAFEKTGKFVLVEDTSLEFYAWNGLPGPLIKWFLDTVGNEGILRMMAGEQDRRAVAKTAFGFFDGNQSHVFVGELAGTVPPEVKGKSGFGWDPIFIPEGTNLTFAEMTSEQKNALSMRHQACLKLKKHLNI